jgi:hypothetical protein
VHLAIFYFYLLISGIYSNHLFILFSAPQGSSGTETWQEATTHLNNLPDLFWQY